MKEYIYFEEPTIDYKRQILEFRKEFDNGEAIEGAPHLHLVNSVEEWLLYLDQFKSWNSVSNDQVPSKQFISFKKNDLEKNRILGVCNIRRDLNEFFFNYGGHISGTVRPSLQNKLYGVMGMQVALREAKNMGLEKVLHVCDERNVTSSRLAEYFGGLYEDTRIDDFGNHLKRYWINLDKY